jgi:hypothetical protein
MPIYHHIIHDHRVGGLYSPLFNIKRDAILIKVVKEVGAGQIDLNLNSPLLAARDEFK